MRNTTTAIMLGACALACGSRTGLAAGEIPTADGTEGEDGGTLATGLDGATSTSPPTTSTSYPFCAFHLGPVDSCDAGLAGGPVQSCDATFPNCLNVGGDWACCTGAGPYNGPGGSCRFESNAPAAFACP